MTVSDYALQKFITFTYTHSIRFNTNLFPFVFSYSARSGDMMGSNLRAARWLDFTNEDDDDGLYQASDSDSESKRKS